MQFNEKSKITDLIKEENEVQGKGDEQSQETEVVEVAGQIVLNRR